MEKIKVLNCPRVYNRFKKCFVLWQVASEVQRINEKDFEVPEVDLCISIRALTTINRTTKVLGVQLLIL